MIQPLLAAGELTVALVVFMLISFISWVLNLVRDQSQKQASPGRQPQPRRPMTPRPDRQQPARDDRDRFATVEDAFHQRDDDRRVVVSGPGGTILLEDEPLQRPGRRPAVQQPDQAQRRMQEREQAITESHEHLKRLKDELEERHQKVEQKKKQRKRRSAARRLQPHVGHLRDTQSARHRNELGERAGPGANAPETGSASMARSIRDALTRPDLVRQAIILNEVLQRPRVLRDR